MTDKPDQNKPQDLPDEALGGVAGGRGSPKPLNPQPLPPIWGGEGGSF